MDNLPKINWIKNNPDEHQIFIDGSVFLVAVELSNGSWDFAVIEARADESLSFYVKDGEYYCAWDWSDVCYFHLMEGEMPCKEEM